MLSDIIFVVKYVVSLYFCFVILFPGFTTLSVSLMGDSPMDDLGRPAPCTGGATLVHWEKQVFWYVGF